MAIMDKLKMIRTLVLILLIAIAGGLALNTIAFSLPVEPIKENLKENFEVFASEMEFEYYRVIENDDATMLDLYTDALMMNTLIYESDQSHFYNAVAAHHSFNEDQTRKDGRKTNLCLCTILAWLFAALENSSFSDDLFGFQNFEFISANPPAWDCG